jgi:ubiquitin
VNSQKLGASQRSFKVMKYPNTLKKAVDCVKGKKRAFKKIVLLRKKFFIYFKKTGAIKRPLYCIILLFVSM